MYKGTIVLLELWKLSKKQLLFMNFALKNKVMNCYINKNTRKGEVKKDQVHLLYDLMFFLHVTNSNISTSQKTSSIDKCYFVNVFCTYLELPKYIRSLTKNNHVQIHIMQFLTISHTKICHSLIYKKIVFHEQSLTPNTSDELIDGTTYFKSKPDGDLAISKTWKRL